MSGNARTIFTIGHSNHELSDFFRLLKRHGITAVADVRSQPHSRLAHYRRPDLEPSLKAEGLQYAFLGRELGARRDELECYCDDRADYDRIARLPAFEIGLERIECGSQTHVIALMCAEKDPLDCHRMVLIGRHLFHRGASIAHILADGSLETQAEAERRLVRLMKIERTLFEPDLGKGEMIERAYEQRGLAIAYRKHQEGATDE